MKPLQILLVSVLTLFAAETIDVSQPYSSGELAFDFDLGKLPFSNGAEITFMKVDQTEYTNGGGGPFRFAFTDSFSTVTYGDEPLDTTLFFRLGDTEAVDTIGIYPSHPVAIQASIFDPIPYSMSQGHDRVFYIEVDGEHAVRGEVVLGDYYPELGVLKWETDSLGDGIFESDKLYDTIAVAQEFNVEKSDSLILFNESTLHDDSIADCVILSVGNWGKAEYNWRDDTLQVQYIDSENYGNTVVYLVKTAGGNCYKYTAKITIQEAIDTSCYIYYSTSPLTSTLCGEAMSYTWMDMCNLTSGEESFYEANLVVEPQFGTVETDTISDIPHLRYTNTDSTTDDLFIYEIVVQEGAVSSNGGTHLRSYYVAYKISIDPAPITAAAPKMNVIPASTIHIYTLNGQRIQTFHDAKFETVEFSTMAPGIYLMRSDKLNISRKFMVK